MTFSNPNAFFGLLLGIPIIGFYLLKVRMRQVPVSTVMFWEQVFDDSRTRSLWQRLRHLLSLIIQLCLLCLLVFSLSDPVYEADTQSGRRMIVVIDTSASMQTRDERGESRIETAQSRLRNMIHTRRSRDERAIIRAGSTVKVVCGLT
ncbi:MAG: VWA domain-containing protein, partial [Fuerstiella sp.]|nr:VWA domain-containing protein [Fuerstiella sp.]